MKHISLVFLCLFAVVFLSSLSISFEANRTNYYRIFITNESYNGNIGGLVGADEICNSSAHLAGLGGNWKAWLSDSQTSVSERFYHARKPYKLLNGRLIARNWKDLTTEKENWIYLRNAIDVNEFGNEVRVSNVMTGTTPKGKSFSNDTKLFCMDYRDDCADGNRTCRTLFGTSSLRDADWTFTNRESCNEKYHLYCFGQP